LESAQHAAKRHARPSGLRCHRPLLGEKIASL
jgi:hypothetical protein